MELQQLKTFLVVVETQSFTQASEVLGYAQSSISTQVKNLEDQLGTRLFERIGRKVFLTDAGERLLPFAQKIIKLEQDAREVVLGWELPKGKLVIGAPESISIYRLPTILREYRQRYPTVEIILKLGSCSDLIQWLKSNQIDLALLLDDRDGLPDLVAERLQQEAMTVVAGSLHPLAGLPQLTPEDLEGEQLILIEKDACYRCLFEAQLAAAQVTPGSVLEIGSIETVKKCLASGLGISLLPMMSVEHEIAAGQLKQLLWTGDEFKIYTTMLYHKDKWLSPALKALISMARELL